MPAPNPRPPEIAPDPRSPLMRADFVEAFATTGRVIAANHPRPIIVHPTGETASYDELVALFAASCRAGALRRPAGAPAAAPVRVRTPELIEGGL